MKKCFLCFILFLFQIGFSQQNQNWKGSFSYNQIKDVSESSTRIYAAAQNALFSKNLNTNEVKTTNTIDGLSGQTISALYHSETFNKTIIGYENGLMIVINDADGTVLNVVDIINKNIPANIKKVNHFMEYNGIVYVSCDFGIVQYKLATLEFGDTYFIGPSGQEIKVYQTAVFNGEIYAVTQNDGIRKAAVTNPNLNDFAQWQVFNGGYFTGIVTFNNQLIIIGGDNNIYKYNGSFQQIGNLGQPSVDIRAYGNYLIVTGSNNVFVYNTSFVQAAHVLSSQVTAMSVTFTCATVVNDTIYIGTNENGIVSSRINTPTNFEFIMPNGPKMNNMFSINSSSTNLWAVYGGYDIFYNPYTFLPSGLGQFGISKYDATNTWSYIPYSVLPNTEALTRITVNPNDENQVFISSYNRGLLQLDSDAPTTLFNESNSSLKSLGSPSTTGIRISASTYDRSGNLWVTNSRVNNGLNVLKSGGAWQAYDMSSILSDVDHGDFSRIAIDRSGTKWMATYLDGVIAYNETTNIYKKITQGEDLGNLPSVDVRALAIDNRSQVWIGTNRGLRVISSTGSYNSDDQIKANAIIINENGVGAQLMGESYITDIAVNGSNQKWIATADSGVFLVSYNGQETIYHFTKDNSPLPSDVVNDVEINATTGEVFFATDKGLVSFQGTSTKPADSLNNVYVYPNPVRPNFDGTVKIAGLISKANIKITDIEGNLVYETTSEGGTIEWDTKAFGKYKVASGVYMIFIAAIDASETAVKKVMIIR